MQALVARLHAAGARLVMGGHTEVPHAERGEAPWRELELLVAAGVSPTEALRAATREGAAFLGAGGAELGAVRPGAAADIVVVEGDPTQAIARVRQVRAVYAAGRPVDLDRLRTR
jgi:imidazolonepropionase-like amidohydrolase